MQMLTKAYVLENKEQIIKEIIDGKVFIYPTDTLYGIGCNATNSASVEKIRTLKKREDKPFSVIAPNLEWIGSACVLTKYGEEWIGKLPGAYTLILPIKDKSMIAPEVVKESVNLGVRIPNHWFWEVLNEAKVPFVTTSVNCSGEPPMTDFYSLSDEIKNGVDYIVYEGTKSSKASTIIDLTGNEPIIKER